jgi:hypothetical protein
MAETSSARTIVQMERLRSHGPRAEAAIAVNIAVVFHSMLWNTAALVRAVADGAERAGASRCRGGVPAVGDERGTAARGAAAEATGPRWTSMGLHISPASGVTDRKKARVDICAPSGECQSAFVTYATLLGGEARAAGINGCFNDADAKRRFEAASFRNALRRLRPRRRNAAAEDAPAPDAGATNGTKPS